VRRTFVHEPCVLAGPRLSGYAPRFRVALGFRDDVKGKPFGPWIDAASPDALNPEVRAFIGSVPFSGYAPTIMGAPMRHVLILSPLSVPFRGCPLLASPAECCPAWFLYHWAYTIEHHTIGLIPLGMVRLSI
jgi:hypothetical protein